MLHNFIETFHAAKHARAEMFEFDGRPYMLGYAKHLIDHLEDDLQRKGQ